MSIIATYLAVVVEHAQINQRNVFRMFVYGKKLATEFVVFTVHMPVCSLC